MTRSPRENTNRLLELIEDGAIDKDAVITACLSWMSESDVAEMMVAYEFMDDPEGDEENDVESN